MKKRSRSRKKRGTRKKEEEGRKMDILKDGIWVLGNTRKRVEMLEKMTKVYIQR